MFDEVPVIPIAHSTVMWPAVKAVKNFKLIPRDRCDSRASGLKNKPDLQGEGASLLPDFCAMLAFIIRRILMVIPTLLGVTVIVFLMLRITPGDPAELLLGERANPEALDAMREYLGLKEPLYVQYGMFINRAIQLDLGETILPEKKSRGRCTEVSCHDRTRRRGHVISCFFGIILGIISATSIFLVRLHGHGDLPVRGEHARVLARAHAHAPFLLELGWFPCRPDWSGDRLPIVRISLCSMRSSARLAALAMPDPPGFACGCLEHDSSGYRLPHDRSSMLEVLRQDYIKTAKAKASASRRSFSSMP